MEGEKSYEDVVSLAYGIVEMHREIIHLRAEVDRLRRIESEHWKFLNETCAHNQKVSGAMLAAALGDKSIVKEFLNQELLPREVPLG